MATRHPNLWIRVPHHQSSSSSSSSSSSVVDNFTLVSSPQNISPHMLPSPYQYVLTETSLFPFTTLPQSNSWSQLLRNEERSPGAVSLYHHQPEKLDNWDQEDDPSKYLNLWPKGFPVAEAGIKEEEDSPNPKEHCAAPSNGNMSNSSIYKAAGDGREKPTDHHSPESATKKARASFSTHPPLKVRKEKLGDRITALHQLVSPFGKTDTASVLLEATGYIRFLHGQIEALSSPYFRNMRTQQYSDAYDDEVAKDLRSRGLCLIPVGYCCHNAGVDANGAEYWAPPGVGGF